MLDNIWILTEERPKNSVIEQILRQYCDDFNDEILNISKILIHPRINNSTFEFIYDVSGIKLKNINSIFIKTVSGNSSFLDFLVFKQINEPETIDIPIMAIEETKTSDDESRNTGVYQRASKFVYIEQYYPSIVKKYMLYNDELGGKDKIPSDTSVFGTNMLLTLGVKILGKNISKYFHVFSSINELINFKNSMRRPPEGNVPIEIKRNNNLITISGRLSKPADAGNIGHDPNIGALSLISKTLRHLGWTGEIQITRHGISQAYINRLKGSNKFLSICKMLNLTLENITIPERITLGNEYWHYEHSSEKITSIFLHVLCEYYGVRGIYENHAGCERGYFKDINNNLITLPKKDKNNINLYLPDVVLHNPLNNTILLIEGKKISTISNGLSEIEDYDSIENEYIKPWYQNCTIYRYLSIFGGTLKILPNPKVLIYINDNGNIIFNHNAPDFIKEICKKEKISI